MDRLRYHEQDSRPIAAVAQAALGWAAGSGLLRLHAALFAVAAAVLLAANLIQNPDDLWAPHVLKIWLIVLACHVAAVVAGWGTWRAVRPHRLDELSATLPSVVSESSAEPYEPEPLSDLLAAGDWQGEQVQPVAASGRFSPRPDDAVAGGDDTDGLGGALDGIRTAISSGWMKLRRLSERFVAIFVREEDEDEAEPAPVSVEGASAQPPPSNPETPHAPAAVATAAERTEQDAAPANGTAPVWQTVAPHTVIESTLLGLNGGSGAMNGHHSEARPPLPRPGTDRSWMETAASAWVVRTEPPPPPRERTEPEPDPDPVPPGEGDQPAAGAG